LIACIKAALSNRPQHTKEKPEVIGAVNVQISSRSFAIARPLLAQAAPIVVIVHRSNPVLSLTRSQLRFLFLRLISYWPWGGIVVPVDLPED
jgi:hypothetical protein